MAKARGSLNHGIGSQISRVIHVSCGTYKIEFLLPETNSLYLRYITISRNILRLRVSYAPFYIFTIEFLWDNILSTSKNVRNLMRSNERELVTKRLPLLFEDGEAKDATHVNLPRENLLYLPPTYLCR